MYEGIFNAKKWRYFILKNHILNLKLISSQNVYINRLKLNICLKNINKIKMLYR